MDPAYTEVAFVTVSLYIIFLCHMADLFQRCYENVSVHDYVLMIQDRVLFSFWKIMLSKCLSLLVSLDSFCIVLPYDSLFQNQIKLYFKVISL